MGIYLNPGNQGFRESIRSKIYVDKTNLIACTNEMMNTNDKYICVTRPRRFGKSMALEMLAAYYSSGCDSRELFAGFKIENDESFKAIQHDDRSAYRRGKDIYHVNVVIEKCLRPEEKDSVDCTPADAARPGGRIFSKIRIFGGDSAYSLFSIPNHLRSLLP